MSELNGRAVKLIRVHSAVYVAGVGQLGGAGAAIDKNSGKLAGEVSLTKASEGVLLKWKSAEVLVPMGNIIVVQFEPEAK